MQIFCEKCRHPQEGNEKNCVKCGAAYGGETSTLVIGAILLIVPTIVLIATGNSSVFASPLLFVGYFAPVIVGTAFLYDHDRSRRGVYFWGGSAAILAGLAFVFSK